MSKKRLLVCPVCFKNGRKEVLGELDENGNFIIKRYHQGTTRIISPQFIVQCGVCGEVVFYRRDKNAKEHI